MQETSVRSLGQEDPLEVGTATHSSILAWRIPWTEEPGGLWFIESQSGTRLKRLTTHAQTIEMPGAHSVPVLYPCRDLAVLPQEEATEEMGMQS